VKRSLSTVSRRRVDGEVCSWVCVRRCVDLIIAIASYDPTTRYGFFSNVLHGRPGKSSQGASVPSRRASRFSVGRVRGRNLIPAFVVTALGHLVCSCAAETAFRPPRNEDNTGGGAARFVLAELVLSRATSSGR